MNVRAIKELIRQYQMGISPRRMGQCFLVDTEALARVALTLGATSQDRILEIGAGLGALTDQLVSIQAPIIAVEKDPRFFKVLSDRFRGVPNVELVQADVLKINLSSYTQAPSQGLLLVGNIPYSMTSLILEWMLSQRRWIRRAVLTVQKEVAQRIVASCGSKVYSSISVLVQVAFKPSIAFYISPGAFYPQPKVTSAVLSLKPLVRRVVPPEKEEAVLKLTRQLFLHRRKTLLNALELSGLGLDRQVLRTLLESARMDPSVRPERLAIEEILRLSNAVAFC